MKEHTGDGSYDTYIKAHTGDGSYDRAPIFNPKKIISIQKYLKYNPPYPYEKKYIIKDWMEKYKVLPPSSTDVNNTVLWQDEKMYEEIQQKYLGSYNLSVIDNEDYIKDNKYCVVKFNYGGLKFPSKIKFKEYMEVNEKILFLLYNIYNHDDKIREKELYYFYEKDKASTHSIEHKILRSSTEKKWSIMELFGYLRNYQLIMIKKIYSHIMNLYLDIKSKKPGTTFNTDKLINIINDEENAFKKWLEEKAFIRWSKDNKIDIDVTDYESKKEKFKKYLEANPEANLYRIITKDEAKLKFIYSMFMEYLRTIYIPEIVANAFMNIAEYSKFNIFNTHYVRNLLLIKNNFFYQTTLEEDLFDFKKIDDSKVVEQFKDEIKRINSIINGIDTFINELDTDETSETTKALGCKLLSIKREAEYNSIIEKYMFFCNIQIDYAIFYIFPNGYTYDSDIIVSPATTLNKENNFCDIIEDIPEEEGIEKDKKIKLFGLFDRILNKYRMTCPDKYESSDCLTISSPISNFMLFYWSPFVNAYLTDKSINDKNNNVLIWDKEIKPYTMSSRIILKHNTSNQLKNLLTTRVYLGFIKITVSDGIKLIFVFIKLYFIELYDIYGFKLICGNYNPFSFITSQEIPLLVGEYRHIRKLKYTGNTNKDYYLFLKTKLTPTEIDYIKYFDTRTNSDSMNQMQEDVRTKSDSMDWRKKDETKSDSMNQMQEDVRTKSDSMDWRQKDKTKINPVVLSSESMNWRQKDKTKINPVELPLESIYWRRP